MTLNIFKAAVRTLDTRPDYLLIAQGVRHMLGCRMSEREIYRAALAVSPNLSLDTWLDHVKTAFEKHPN
jgi:hypothetical protein